MANFKPLNMAVILSAAVVTQYLRGKLSTDPAYRLFDNERDDAGTKPAEQAQSDRSPLPPRRRAF